MLDREVVKEFLSGEFEDIELDVPEDIDRDSLIEAFCGYVEEDYYEWLKDNFESFFDHGNPDWGWIKGRIEQYSAS